MRKSSVTDKIVLRSNLNRSYGTEAQREKYLPGLGMILTIIASKFNTLNCFISEGRARWLLRAH